MKKVLVLLALVACGPTSTVQEKFGARAHCRRGPDRAVLCTVGDKHYMCYVSDEAGDDFTLCFEAFTPEEL